MAYPNAGRGLGIRCVCPNSNSRMRNFTYVNDKSLPLKLTYWDSNEPNNNNCQEDCVTMKTTNGVWNDEDCYKKYAFICQSEKKLESIVQFKNKEQDILVLKSQQAINIIIHRLFTSWDKATIQWKIGKSNDFKN